METATITRKPNSSRLNVSKRKVRREKTFTGCWMCRSRKVKCDEGKPECATCKKRGQKCTGYEPKYIWVTGYQNYPPGERRVLRSELTWYGHTIYPPTEVDQLIAHCNIEDHSEAEPLQKAAGPFTVLKFCTLPKIPPSLPELPDCSSDDDRIVEELRYHYFTHTALNMMPFKHEKNPWLSSYPRIAHQGSIRGQKSLYYAILAQAAGNLAQLGSRSQKMSKLATKFYTDGLKHLRINLKSMDFSTMLASIGTLIMAEVYAGLPSAWRMHLNGAWTFLMTRKNEKPWDHSNEAWLMAQSLCLVKIRADTMEQPRLHDKKQDETVKSVISSIAHRYEFGFTAGAGQSLMKCIQDITSLESQLKFQETDSAEEIQNAIEELHQRIKHCRLEYLAANELMALHHDIFRTGVQIHFHRRILNCIPSALVSDLDYMLNAMERYQTLEEGRYISLWPVFIGAVEAVEERHKRQVRAWMDNVEKMGAANRKDVRSTIEAVWNKRAQQTKILGHDIEEGEIIVDWREVMQEMKAEILLV